MRRRARAVDHVLDYAAMGQPTKKPARLHLADCWHPSVTARWRKATREELRKLPECQDCAHRADA